MTITYIPTRQSVCETCCGRGVVGGFVSADSGYQDDPCPDCSRPAQSVPDGWQPIETAPKGARGYAWMMLAWGAEDDPYVAAGMRCGDKFFAATTFYCLGQEKQYEMREIEVHPTHWMPIPAPPKPEDSQ